MPWLELRVNGSDHGVEVTPSTTLLEVLRNRLEITSPKAQCGYCTPGMIMAAKALLDDNPVPTRGEIKEALSGNLCRCTGYVKIIESIESVARETADREVI